MTDKRAGYDDRRGKALLLVVIAALVSILVILIQHMVLTGRAARAAEEAYQQGLAEGESRVETIVLDEKVKVDVATLREVVAPAAKLTAYEYYYTDVGVYEKSQKLFQTDIVLPFTTDKTLYTYTGKIAAGIDLGRVTFQVDHTKNTILVGLPDPAILSHEMGREVEFYDVKKAVFGPSDFNDFEAFRSSLMARQEEKLRDNEEFWQSVRDNTEVVLRDLLTASGQVEDYDITFRW